MAYRSSKTLPRSLRFVLLATSAFAFGSALAAGCATGVSVSPSSGAGGSGGGGDETSATSTSKASASATGSTSATVSTGQSSSSSGVPTTCVKKEDCAGLDDACNAGNCINGMCEKAPANEGGPCDDGLYCTDDDACQMGMCVGGSMKFCPSPDSCHVGSCDEGMKACGSAPGNDGASCDDGDPCTYSGTCGGGTCSKGPPVDCSNFDSMCGDGVCDPVLGCQAKPKNNGAACDDGLYCTVNDVCTNGTCTGAPNTCAAPGDVCLVGTCDEATKSCKAVPGNNGGACDDKSACTSGETCSNGVCGGGAPANQGGVCDDGKVCTKTDVCSGGVCAGTPIVACASNDGCCPAGCSMANDNDCTCNINLGLSAKASVSPGGGMAPGYDPPVMNDGVGPKCNGFSWVSDNTQANGAWAELDWPNPVTVGSIFVETENGVNPMCGSPGRNIASATLQWWNGSVWVTSTQWAAKEGDIQIDLPSPVTTTKIRMFNMTSDPGNGNSIIFEWHVYQGSGCQPPP